MKLKQTALLIMSLGMIATAQASYKQEINLCLNVEGNTGGLNFLGYFRSDDLFERTKYTKPVINGKTCFSHVYKKGPKQMTLGVDVGGLPHSGRHVLITPNGTCPYMLGGYNGKATSNLQKTGFAQETWTFNLKQLPPINGVRYNYELSCEHSFK